MKQRPAQCVVTQSVQTVQVDPVQHIIWHVAGSMWLVVQDWKHARLCAHSMLPRQASVSSQHPPTMHWLHGVPPGSSIQVPASMSGVPQFCPLHASPTQH